MQNRLICICGPTASGKTALSILLAKQYHTEIISADSMQLYQGLDIGTAKPSAEEQEGVCHHMLDLITPEETFSVAQYVEMADACAQEILQRGKIPIVIGGTGLYMDALIECSTFSGEETDSAIRQKYQQMAIRDGVTAVHDCLLQVDPESADKLHPNNLKRVIRALEVFESTGETIGTLNRKNKRPAPKYEALKIGLCPSDRAVLYNRIDRRVDQMLEQGLLAEAERVYHMPNLSITAAQAIGYKEFFSYFSGQSTLAESIALLKQKSRNYAKRQLTWLKKDDSIHWIYYNRAEEIPIILQEATQFLHLHGVQ